MSINCVSQLVADDTELAIPGGTRLRFDVQIDNGVTSFSVKYTILTSANLVRFESGRPDETVVFNVSAAEMRVEHRPRFVCADPNQSPTGFVSFTIEARVIVDGELACTPNSHPAIRVTAWNCSAADGTGAMKIHQGEAFAIN